MKTSEKHLANCSIFLSALFLLFAGSSLIANKPSIAQGNDDLDQYVFLPLALNEYDPAWQWTSSITCTLSPPPRSTQQPLAAIDQQGRLHLLWDTSSYGEAQFIYHTYLSANGWISATAVAESLGYSYTLYPPTRGADGKIHLLWQNSLTTSGPCRLLYANFSKDHWSGEEEAYRREGSCSFLFSSLQGMVHQADDTVYVTLLDGGIYQTKFASQSWDSPTQIPSQDYQHWIWPDQRGGVHIYGNDYLSPPTLYYSHWRDGYFIEREKQASGEVNGRQTQLDGMNNLHIFWTGQVPIPGGTVTGLYHQCLDDDLNLSSEQVLSGEQSAYSVIKAAGEGKSFALAWKESDANRIRVATWMGCDQTDLKTIPLSSDITWTPKSLAVSDNPHKLCVLVYTSGHYPNYYATICVDILR